MKSAREGRRAPKSLAGLFGALVSISALGAFGVVGAGCESESGSYCGERCACQGCSQVERDDCVDDVEDADRLAEFDGCAEAYASYLDCYVNQGTCSSGAWIAMDCSAKATALRDCSTRAARFIRTPCQDEKGKFESCGLSGGGQPTCTPDAECVAYCSLAASCEELANPQNGSTYVDCVLACSGSTGTSSGGSNGGSSGGSSGGTGGG